jgi:hypothetical protein
MIKNEQIVFFIFFLLSFFLIHCSSTKINDCEEKKIFLNQLNIIESFLYKDSLDLSLRRAGAIMFLEMITNIYSESTFDYEYKLNPTKNDFVKWKNWLHENEDSLCTEPYKIKIDTTYKLVYSL